jgi:glycosyltransferase involved in cell wall biosynthesis
VNQTPDNFTRSFFLPDDFSQSFRPGISVIVPVYNSGKYLPRCLESLINQTFQNIEILCIDDGSTDDSAEILKNYAKKHNQIKIVTQDHSGPGGARNTALRHARSDFIMFCDSDDTYDVEMCETMFFAMLENNADLVKCRFTGIDCSGKCHREKTICSSENGFHPLDNQWKGMLGRGIWNKIFKRDIIECSNISFPPFRIGEDISFLLQYEAAASSCFIIPDNLYHYYLRDDSTAGCYEKSARLYQTDIIESYKYTLRYLCDRSLVKNNLHVLFHLSNELTNYWSNKGTYDSQFFRLIKQEILCYYTSKDFSLYPLLKAIHDEDDKKAIDVLNGLRIAQVLGIHLPSGVEMVKVTKKGK